MAEKAQTEKEKCLARMRKNLEENEHIIRIKIQNDRSTALGIAAEPLGLADPIPANTIWE